MRVSIKRVLFALAAAPLGAAIMAALLFLTAGRWDLPWFWAYLVVYWLFGLSAWLLLDKGLIKERLRPGKNAQDKGTLYVGKALGLAHCVIAGLDVGRFHWSDRIPVAVQAIALALVVLTAALVVWAMVVNRFFSTVVRIQGERGHHLITDGPYRFVRHPGYVAICVMLLVNGMALGSWLSIVPMAILFPLILRRTALEDRFLHEHLQGYADYADRVRYRLIPRVW